MVIWESLSPCETQGPLAAPVSALTECISSIREHLVGARHHARCSAHVHLFILPFSSWKETYGQVPRIKDFTCPEPPESKLPTWSCVLECVSPASRDTPLYNTAQPSPPGRQQGPITATESSDSFASHQLSHDALRSRRISSGRMLRLIVFSLSWTFMALMLLKRPGQSYCQASFRWVCLVLLGDWIQARHLWQKHPRVQVVFSSCPVWWHSA